MRQTLKKPRPLRIGIAAMDFSQLGESGGVNVYARQLVEALADFDTGNEYFVFLYDFGARTWNNRLWPDNVKLVFLKWELPRPSLLFRQYHRLRFWLKLPNTAQTRDSYVSQQIEQYRLDVVHFPGTIISPLSLKVPCVLTFFDLQHEYYPEFFEPQELLKRDITYRASVDKASHIIAPSGYTHDSLIDKYSVNADRITFIPVGIRDSLHPASLASVVSVRQKYNLPEQYIYYPANPWPHKNHARLMAALRACRDSFGHLPTLVLSGRLKGESRDALLLAIAAGIETHVIDLGFIATEDVHALYSGAAFLIFPSLFEGFGLPLLEAMASGCPIAAANATAIPECVGPAAILFDPFDIEAMSDTIHMLANDAALRQSLSELGIERSQQFHWQRIVPQVTAVYQTVAEGNN